MLLVPQHNFLRWQVCRWQVCSIPSCCECWLIIPSCPGGYPLGQWKLSTTEGYSPPLSPSLISLGGKPQPRTDSHWGRKWPPISSRRINSVVLPVFRPPLWIRVKIVPSDTLACPYSLALSCFLYSSLPDTIPQIITWTGIHVSGFDSWKSKIRDYIFYCSQVCRPAELLFGSWLAQYYEYPPWPACEGGGSADCPWALSRGWGWQVGSCSWMVQLFPMWSIRFL